MPIAHIAAKCIILMDAESAGTLIDDPFKIEGYEEGLLQVQALRARCVAVRAAGPPLTSRRRWPGAGRGGQV